MVRESPDGGPALTVIDPSNFNPQPSAARVPEVPARRTTNPLLIGDRSPLIAKSNVKISDREQIILDWLRENDYPDATHADAKAIDKMTRNMWPGKNIATCAVSPPTAASTTSTARSVRNVPRKSPTRFGT
ncbi:hypothetical protein HCB39_30000 [Salinispora arenicola]|nr:hypothetical protein [Salinispora arenicola]